jgi:hypothetical protein
MIAGLKVQVAAYKAAPAGSNIEVGASQGGGRFLAGPAEGVAKNLHPGRHVILSTGDRMTHGAELAVNALHMQGKVKLIGLGASIYGIAAVRAGRWYRTVVTLPQSIGRIGPWGIAQPHREPKARAAGHRPGKVHPPEPADNEGGHRQLPGSADRIARSRCLEGVIHVC